MFNMTMYYIGFIWEKAVGASVHRMCITQNPQRDRSPIYALQSTSRKWVRLEKVPIKTLPDDIGALPMINIHWWPNVKHMSLNLAFLGSHQMILAIVVKLLHTYYVRTTKYHSHLLCTISAILQFHMVWQLLRRSLLQTNNLHAKRGVFGFYFNFPWKFKEEEEDHARVRWF